MNRAVPKPQSLLDLHEPMVDLFDLVRRTFDVPLFYRLSFTQVDVAEDEMHGTLALAALTLRKVQALRYVTTPGVRTAVHVVVNLASELGTALADLAGRCTDPASSTSLAAYRDRIYEVGYDAASFQQENTVLILE